MLLSSGSNYSGPENMNSTVLLEPIVGEAASLLPTEAGLGTQNKLKAYFGIHLKLSCYGINI